MQNYNPNHLPDMTEKQALHILNQPYKAFPDDVRSQALAIATGMQERLYRQSNQFSPYHYE